jgi:hypothetical protein
MYRAKYFLPLLFLVVTGCYYDNVAELYPNSTNCTEQPNSTFSGVVLPLLTKRCNSCHGGTNPSAGIDLTTYPEVMKYVNNESLMGSINQSSGIPLCQKIQAKCLRVKSTTYRIGSPLAP